MPKIRVLIVDDSVVIRNILGEILSADPMLEVVGKAGNGKIALSLLPILAPDIVTMDIEMPEMDGITTVKELRKTHPKLPVIMFSTLTKHAAAATLEALGAGATDYATKPTGSEGMEKARQTVQGDLLPKIKALGGKKLGIAVVSAAAPKIEAHTPRVRNTANRIDVVAIGVSTGGPNALAELMPLIPMNFPVPIVIVQHMPPVFTKLLAERLSASCSIQVVEAVEGQPITPGKAYLAPGGFHMVLANQNTTIQAHLNEEAPENSCRPSVDVLFRSVVKVYGPHVLGVILTGMGSDGLRGCESIYENGGGIVAQDEATSVVWGMPGFVAKAGIADRVLPLPQIGQEIIRSVSVQRKGL